jgi:general stress protein CsbA
MLNVLLALILPFFMMLFFTRVSYSKIGALLVTLMIVIFAFDGLKQTIPVIIAGSVSIAAGYWISLRIQKKNRGV